VGDIGTLKGTKPTNKLIGLRVNDLLMDELWLCEFKNYMENSLSDPLNTQEILECFSSYPHPSHMKPLQVYQNLWKAYEKFLYMAAKHPPTKGQYVHPSYAIDVIWHSHMICPKKYAKETKEWVGYLVDHEPWPDSDSKEMEKSGDTTNALWQKEFGVDLHKEHIVHITVKDELNSMLGGHYSSFPFPDIPSFPLPDDNDEEL